MKSNCLKITKRSSISVCIFRKNDRVLAMIGHENELHQFLERNKQVMDTQEVLTPIKEPPRLLTEGISVS